MEVCKNLIEGISVKYETPRSSYSVIKMAINGNFADKYLMVEI